MYLQKQKAMKYLLSSKKNGDLASFSYNENGIIQQIQFHQELSEQQFLFLSTRAYKSSHLSFLLEMLLTKDQSAYLEEISPDLSFERFWETYDHKVGKKARVKKKWDSMPPEERVKALKHLKKYSYFLAQNPTIAKKYPETYLNAEEWNN